MMNKTEDPDFVASWQKVEEALKRLDENQVERLFSKKHGKSPLARMAVPI